MSAYLMIAARAVRRRVRRWAERNDEPWTTSNNVCYDTGDPDRDCAGRVVGSPHRGAGVRRADRQQSDRHTASYCRLANHTTSNSVGHHDAGGSDRANCGANSGSDCHTGADAPSKRDREPNGDTRANSNGNARSDAHCDEGANGASNSISNQDRERNGSANGDSANGDPDRDTGPQANALNDAHPSKHSNAHHSATERQREGDTGACAGWLDEHHL